MAQKVPNFKPFIPKESVKMAIQTLKSGWIGGDGPKVKEFEKKISKIINNKNVVALNSGTSALQLALKIIGVHGHQVISTPMTCFATNAAIAAEGADIVWSDVDPQSGNIDPADIERKISKKTKAIMVVHWGGNPAQLDKIAKIAKSYKIPVIEDAAQALGSQFGNKPIGSHSEYICFSTQAVKIINTVDGGILATKSQKDAKKARLLRWYGIDRETRHWGKTFWHYPIREAGFKMQMTNVAAAIGLGQLPYLAKLLNHRRKLAKIYQNAISKSSTLKSQKILKGAVPNYWMFTTLCGSWQNRLKLVEALAKINVTAEEAHRRNDLYPVFQKYKQSFSANKKEHLPGVTEFNNQELIVPNGFWVTEKKASQIAHILAGF